MPNELLISILGLLMAAVGGLSYALWSQIRNCHGRVDKLQTDFADQRVEIARRYITSESMERAIDQALEPTRTSLVHVEDRLRELVDMLREQNRHA